jgi:hypothetical protein
VPSSANDVAGSYFELQIDGGATMQNVAKVVFEFEPSAAVRRGLNELQIPSRVRLRRGY